MTTAGTGFPSLFYVSTPVSPGLRSQPSSGICRVSCRCRVFLQNTCDSFMCVFHATKMIHAFEVSLFLVCPSASCFAARPCCRVHTCARGIHVCLWDSEKDSLGVSGDPHPGGSVTVVPRCVRLWASVGMPLAWTPRIQNRWHSRKSAGCCIPPHPPPPATGREHRGSYTPCDPQPAVLTAFQINASPCFHLRASSY